MVSMRRQGDIPPGPFDRLWSSAQWTGLLVPLAALPWMFGGVTTTAQLVLAATVAVGLLLWLIRFHREAPPLPALLLPLLLGLALGAFQLLPLGSRLQAALSPRGAEYWQATAVGDDSERQFRAEVGSWSTGAGSQLSLHPAATRYELALLALAVGLFLLGAQVFSTPTSQKVLWGAFAANGALFAFFGLTQQITWSGKIYGQYSLSQGGQPFAAFVNRNNGAGYLNLCLAAAIGFLLAAYVRRRGSSHDRLESDSESESDVRQKSLGIIGRTGAVIGGLTGAKLFAITAVSLLVVGVVSALSRGGWVSLAAGLAVVTTALATTRRATFLAWTGLVVLLVTLGMIQWLGRSAAIEARWQKLLQQFDEPTDGRLSHWADSWKTSRDFLWLGTGLGTYRYAYRPYEEEFRSKTFYHAENQYVEALTVGGVVGLGLLLVAVVMATLACRRLLREPRESTAYIAGIVGIYALVSQGVHALFDFGLYLPANMALFALLMGSVTGRAARCLPEYGWSKFSWSPLLPPLGLRPHAGLVPAAGTLLLCASLWGVVEVRRAGAVEAALRTTRVMREGRKAELPEIKRSLVQVAEAIERRPDDADGQYALARLLVHRYRVRMFWLLRRQTRPEVSDESLWQRTSPLSLHGTVERFEREGRTIELENLRQSEWVQGDLKQAARALVLATRGSPLPASPLVLLAELAPVVSPHRIDAELLARARNRVGADHRLLMESGFVEIQAGRTELGLADLRRSAELQPSRIASALRTLAAGFPAERLVREALPDRPALLVKLARDDFQQPEDELLREALLTRVAELLEREESVREAALERGERDQLESVILALRGRVDEAVECQSRAVEARPEKTAWRFQLAELLRDQGNVELAWEHARTCVRMEPDNRSYERLLRELIRARLTSR